MKNTVWSQNSTKTTYHRHGIGMRWRVRQWPWPWLCSVENRGVRSRESTILQPFPPCPNRKREGKLKIQKPLSIKCGKIDQEKAKNPTPTRKESESRATTITYHHLAKAAWTSSARLQVRQLLRYLWPYRRPYRRQLFPIFEAACPTLRSLAWPTSSIFECIQNLPSAIHRQSGLNPGDSTAFSFRCKGAFLKHTSMLHACIK